MAYGYLLLGFPYYHHCKLFHANHPLLLLRKSNDEQLYQIKLCSDLLEEFLDEKLPGYIGRYSPVLSHEPEIEMIGC